LEGNLYEVDLPDEHIAKMLDWDAPLSEQPESVRRALDSISERLYGRRAWARIKDDPQTGSNMTGGDLYKRLVVGQQSGVQRQSWPAPQGQQAASEMLNKAGIPGIKYWDGGSRAAGEGTRNYVVFDENIITITKRNGEPVTQAEREQVLPESPAPLAQQNPLPRWHRAHDVMKSDYTAE
jgi:hypothetical protein